ncbi:cation:proton antiporter [Acuticoccus sp. M5D2P5]|uniref:cation:proton antiporter n=1 Tax=Acuticoccus kalidii TaxID=2910977 RepID=UPI001F2C5F09|nr:cation:proton antiporter [Acuticoccus kalidii]MCF3933178.1 cation:proton antiporter [Acuticoccus kalidii]
MYETVTVLALIVLVYGASANAVERTPFAGAVLFAVIGLMLGQYGFGLLEVGIEAEDLRILAELALALVLFTDASNTDMTELRKIRSLPQRLLLGGLPLTIGLGFLAGWVLFPGAGLAEIAVLAIALSPTDAALGKAVVTNPAVPNRIRTALNVESGLNDGICVPFFLVALAIATDSIGDRGVGLFALQVAAREIGLGIGIGLIFSILAVRAIGAASARGWISVSWRQVLVPALALACFGSAQQIGGSGFIACFVAGLAFGALEGRHREPLIEAAEGLGDTLALALWVLFGAAAIGPVLSDLRVEVVVYAILSLTVVRMLPVWLSLSGTDLGTREKLFVGWFGPRGLASIVFAVMAIDAVTQSATLINQVAVVTIGLSVLCHGATATPLARWLAGHEPKPG